MVPRGKEKLSEELVQLHVPDMQFILSKTLLLNCKHKIVRFSFWIFRFAFVLAVVFLLLLYVH